MLSNFARVAMLAVLAISASACGTATQKTAVKQQPIAVPTFEETKPIAFKKIVLKVPRYQPVGDVSLGIACLKRGDYTISGGRHSLNSERFNDIFRQQLESANYEVVGDPDELFGDPELDKAEYFIAGLINDLEANICYPFGGFGNFSTSSAGVYMSVEWQLYDTLRRQVVYKTTTEGSADTDSGPNGADKAFDQAFSSAVNNLLAKREFHALVREGSQPDAPATASARKSVKLTAAQLRFGDGAGLQNEPLERAVAVVRSSSGHGSGFLITPNHLLTNEHVVGSAEKVRVIFVDGSELDGVVLRRNAYRDVALIAIQERSRRPLSMAEDRPKIGEDVFSYGAPLDEKLSGTLRRGIVSAYRVERGLEYLQSDAGVNPGNSGGPLLDKQGNVVALSVSGVFVGQSNQGLNFFIPIDRALIALDISPPTS